VHLQKGDMAHNYTLRVTAGSEYDPKSHKIVPVNTATPVSIQSELIDVDLNVRIQVCPPFPYACTPAQGN
jgi:hypothetical protein